VPGLPARYAPPTVVKRHLPLIQSASEGADEPPRSVWQWVGFGAVAIFVAWVPLSLLAGVVGTRALAGARDEEAMTRAAIVSVVAYGLDLTLGAFLGGFLLGRWGKPGVDARHAGLAGLAAVVLLGAMMGVSRQPALGLLPVAALVPLAAALGGAIGFRARTRASSPSGSTRA
jgi:hypothetical protein